MSVFNETGFAGNEGGWFDSILNLIDSNDPRSDSFRHFFNDRIIQPIAQTALRTMLPYFASLILLLSITVILLGVVIYFLANKSDLKINPVDLNMTVLDFSDGL